MAKALNMRLIAQHELNGFGGLGEGMSLQLAKDGRRILWLAHESAPKNFTGVDVSDPRELKMVVQTDLPHRQMRSNSLEVCGDIMAVAYQTQQHGQKPAGVEMFDISNPEDAALHLDVRLLGPAFARRAPAVVRRWRDRAFLGRRRRLHAAQSQGRPVLPRDRRAQPVEAGGDLPLVDARHPRGRQRAAAAAPSEIRRRLPHPQHQRLSRAAGPRLSRLYRRRRVDPRHRRTNRGQSRSGTGTRIRPFPASRTRRCRSSTATSWW